MRLSLIISVYFCISLSAHAAVYKFGPEMGKLSFLAKGRPALISIKGEGEGVSGQLTEADQTLNGRLVFNLDSLKTGIDLRDEHMKKRYLETEKFKDAFLQVDKVLVPKEIKELNFSAVLTLHGIEQRVPIKATVTGAGVDRKMEAEFSVKLSEFKIEIPNFQGITVAEDVAIKFVAPIQEITQ